MAWIWKNRCLTLSDRSMQIYPKTQPPVSLRPTPCSARTRGGDEYSDRSESASHTQHQHFQLHGPAQQWQLFWPELDRVHWARSCPAMSPVRLHTAFTSPWDIEDIARNSPRQQLGRSSSSRHPEGGGPNWQRFPAEKRNSPRSRWQAAKSGVGNDLSRQFSPKITIPHSFQVSPQLPETSITSLQTKFCKENNNGRNVAALLLKVKVDQCRLVLGYHQQRCNRKRQVQHQRIFPLLSGYQQQQAAWPSAVLWNSRLKKKRSVCSDLKGNAFCHRTEAAHPPCWPQLTLRLNLRSSYLQQHLLLYY